MSRSHSAAPGPPRRAVLTGAPLLLLAAACTAGVDPAPRPDPDDPDAALRRAAAARERALLREYDAALAARPGLAPRLVPVRGHHAEHLEALLGPSATGSPSRAAGSRSPSASAAALPAVPPPADDAPALARLVAAERDAGAAHARDCLTASRALAPVLASLSASELSHPVALA